MLTVKGDLDYMSSLDNCDGHPEPGCADEVEAGSQTVLQGRCDNAWDGSEASQDCGSSLGAHSVSISGQQCHVSTTCGTLAGASSFFGSPNQVRSLRYCGGQLQQSSSCPPPPVPPIPVTAQNCSDAWYVSGASNTCYSSSLGALSITVSGGMCQVSTPCRKTYWGSEFQQASFSGKPEQVQTLRNCGGTLKEKSC